MATYALTFATRAAFDTSLASGDIYNLMQGVTSSKPSVAITATITESGETFACGTNVMVDIKSVGPGDYVMYDSTNDKFFGIASKWIDNNYPAQPTQHIMIFKAGVLPARYVVCGTVIKRFGNRIRLVGEWGYKPWSTTGSNFGWDVPAIPHRNSTYKKSRTTTTNINNTPWLAFPSQRYQEAQYPSGNARDLPILRSTWNAAVQAGEATVTENGKTAILADFQNNYDRFLSYNYAPLWPANSGSFADSDGFGCTSKIVSEFIANHGKTINSDDYAAGYCYNYSINAPGLGKHNWFLGTLKDIGEVRPLTHTVLTPSAWGTGYIWSVSQITSTEAWGIGGYGGIDYRYAKNTAMMAFPLADLILEN